MRDRPRALSGWVGVLLLAGCNDPASEGAPPPATTLDELAMPEVRTTNAELALRNLDGLIEEGERKYAARPRMREAEPLVETYLARFRVLGRLHDLDRAVEIVDGLPDASGAAAARAFELRADLLAIRHLFAEAELMLDRAEAAGADPEAQLDVRAAIDVALGAPERASRHLELAPETFGVLFLKAAALAEAGEFRAADEEYVEALRAFRDVSPFPVAETWFRRGVMWSEMAGRSDLGAAMYRAGLDALGLHVTMTIHGAELVAEGGDRAAAIASLEALLERTDEPELAGFLGELRLAADLPGEALIERARAGYETRLARHREAYLDHASEFFRGPGADPERGLRLALENLELRPNQRAHLLALEAALELGDRATACAVARQARERGAKNVDLAAAVAELAPEC